MRRTERKKFASEVELADAVARWAEAHGWDVYKEVHTDDGDIDLLLIQGRTMWIVETKLRLSHEVLEQAYRRLSYAYLVSVAVPSLPSGKDASMVNQHFMESYGIGLIEVGHPSEHKLSPRHFNLPDGRLATTYVSCDEVNWQYVCREEVRPKVWRPNDYSPHHYVRRGKAPSVRKIRAKRMAALRAFLRPEHKTLVAGAKNGSQLTPWKVTFMEVQRFLRERGPATVKEIVAGCKAVKDYYRNDKSARAGVARMLIEIKPKEFVKTEAEGETKWGVAS